MQKVQKNQRMQNYIEVKMAKLIEGKRKMQRMQRIQK